MKKIISAFAVILMLLTTAVLSAYAATDATISGSSTVRAGDTITLTVKVTADKAYGVNGEFSYSSDQVTLSSVSSSISGWEVERNGNTFIAYDNNQTKPIKSKTALFTAKFKVKDSLKAGTKITVSIKNVEIDGASGTYSDSYSVTLAEPLSDDAKLKELSVKEGTLTPAFSADTTEYDIGEVDFSVSELNITAKTNHSGATYEIIGNRLSVGKNTVKVVVKAETGTEKEYLINVTRKQDPNYVPSSNAALSEITLSSGTLSPLFDKARLEYIVYVPYETDKITIGGSPDHELALGVTGVTDAELNEGENLFKITCKAEDGTELAYSVTVMRMEQFGVESETPSESDTPSSPNTSDTPVSSTESNAPVASQTDKGNSSGGGASITLVIILVISALLIGVVIGYLIDKIIQDKKYVASMRENESFFKDKQ